MATLLGIILFSEPISITQMIGGALIILGGISQILFSTKKTIPAREDPADSIAAPH